MKNTIECMIFVLSGIILEMYPQNLVYIKAAAETEILRVASQ